MSETWQHIYAVIAIAALGNIGNHLKALIKRRKYSKITSSYFWLDGTLYKGSQGKNGFKYFKKELGVYAKTQINAREYHNALEKHNGKVKAS